LQSNSPKSNDTLAFRYAEVQIGIIIDEMQEHIDNIMNELLKAERET